MAKGGITGFQRQEDSSHACEHCRVTVPLEPKAMIDHQCQRGDLYNAGWDDAIKSAVRTVENYGKGQIFTAQDAGIRIGVKDAIAASVRGLLQRPS